MRRRHLLALAPLLLAPLRRAKAATGLAVMTTFSVLSDMTRVIGAEDVVVSTLVPVDGDAHVWQPRPVDLRALQASRMLVENGLGFEGWMARMAEAARFTGVRVTASKAVIPRLMDAIGHKITDPHAWQDPRNGVLYARAIADGLKQAIPASAAAIEDRARAYVEQILEVDRWIEQTLASVRPEQRRILTSHDAFGYYGARYGITLRSVQGINTDSEPSARDIATLVGQIRREKIRAVFVENMTDPRMAASVAREAGAVIGQAVYSDALSAQGGVADTYLRMLRHNTTQFATAMAVN